MPKHGFTGFGLSIKALSAATREIGVKCIYVCMYVDTLLFVVQWYIQLIFGKSVTCTIIPEVSAVALSGLSTHGDFACFAKVTLNLLRHTDDITILPLLTPQRDKISSSFYPKRQYLFTEYSRNQEIKVIAIMPVGIEPRNSQLRSDSFNTWHF